MKTKLILNTELVKIEQSQNGYHTLIKMQDGGWLEHATFPNELKGLVNALDLATNACAGKFYPKCTWSEHRFSQLEIPYKGPFGIE